MTMIKYLASDWESIEKRARTTFLNSVSGFKNAVLIGTSNQEGHTNLALFNSIVHLGADPAILGFILRPPTVPRHTYENIRLTGHYTFNLITSGMMGQAHRTSAKFSRETSEYDACGFTEHWEASFPAPYVSESPVRIGMQYAEEHHITVNGTILVVGRVMELQIPQQSQTADGFIDLESLDILCSNGLDAYYAPRLIARLPYARP